MGKWPGQDGQSGSFSAAFLSLDRHLAVIEKRIERLEALEKEQRRLQQAECQQQEPLGKRRQPDTQSSSEKSALEGRPVSRSRADAGGRLRCAVARWYPVQGRGCCHTRSCSGPNLAVLVLGHLWVVFLFKEVFD